MSMRYTAGFISAFYDPLKNPNAPTIGTATGGPSSVSVTFTAPSNVGGSAITSYTAISTPGGFTSTAASSPITVSGLSAGTAYTFKVLATNSYGSSVLSAESNSAIPLAIGDAYQGGFFAGQIGVSGVATHNLVIGPRSTAENSSLQWKNTATATSGADSDINGPQNTADMVADGSSTIYPAAHFCNNLVTGGFDDWYMPAKNEIEVCYFNFKPTTSNNSLGSGVNPNAVPVRTSTYTSENPPQTSVVAFRSGGAQAFTSDPGSAYWCSTEFSNVSGRFQAFTYGTQASNLKYQPYRVRAVRRVAV